jgi:hypothetical protein
MNSEAPSKEETILRAMKLVLTNVAKDTATQPGMKHPLREQTIQDIRDCLILISAREKELAEAAGRPWTQRPHYVDEPSAAGDEVVVPLHRVERPPRG